jgi:alpha-glucosidase (family GH31 glycosyl hydrolase)
MKTRTIYLLFCLLLVACNSAVDKEPDGVTVHLKSTPDEGFKTIRLQVVSDKVIRVSASSTGRISTDKTALATFTKGMQEGWSYSYSENDVLLKTGALIVKVLLANGEITFMDKDRKPILAEQKDDTLSFGTLPFIIYNNKYGIFWDNSAPSDLDYYFVYGNSMDEIVSGYRAVVGKAQILPKWALGETEEQHSTDNSHHIVIFEGAAPPALRHRLMPYIYSLEAKSHLDDYTTMRPLVMDFAADSVAWTVNDQYMFGPALMVCPVYQDKSERREVYLPKEQWYDIYSGQQMKGGQKVSVSTPYNRMPLFARAGSIVPVGGDTVQDTNGAQKNLTVFVYDDADGQFSLYEDENNNYNYLQGQYTQIPFTYNNAAKKLTIGERTGEFQGMARERTITVVLVARNSPVGIDWALPAQNVRTIDYEGAAQTLSCVRNEPLEEKTEEVTMEETEEVKPIQTANDSIRQ